MCGYVYVSHDNVVYFSVGDFIRWMECWPWSSPVSCQTEGEEERKRSRCVFSVVYSLLLSSPAEW